MTTNLTRYSPGGYGAMTEDEQGDYVRLSDVEYLLRWRKVGEEMPETVALYLVLQGRMAKLLWWRGDCHDADDWKHFGVTHWRPIGPMPEGGERCEKK